MTTTVQELRRFLTRADSFHDSKIGADFHFFTVFLSGSEETIATVSEGL